MAKGDWGGYFGDAQVLIPDGKWYPFPPVDWATPHCDHCFCKDSTITTGEGKHKDCCMCPTRRAVKFIEASNG